MTALVYRYVSGTVFVGVVLVHAWRAAAAVPVTFGTVAIPVWMSWAAAAGAAVLAVWAFRARA
jgi:hypothetical protein